MTKPVAVTKSNRPLELDALVDAFEAAQVRDGQARVDDFLPDARHPQYRDIVLELLCVDLEYGWQRGKPKGLEEYRAEYPEILSDSGNLKVLAFEEYRQRRQTEAQVDPSEYDRRYGFATSDWPSGPCVDDASHANGALASVHDVTLDRMDEDTDRLTKAVQDFPDIGTRFLQFEIVEELGRGSFARVYLARQDELANRPVVLKISPEFSWEAHRLAQLQHTNIVPIHSVHQEGELQAVCMPFFGRTTLADVIRHRTQRGGMLMPGNAVEDSRSRIPENPGDATAASISADPASTRKSATTGDEESLARLGEVEACVWIAAKYADALAHAHARGILHRDLKPANILLTDDGQPMILDFNLSDDVVSGGRTCVMVGGTLPYMAPEHLRAIESGDAVDERADIYSAGVILFEMLTGQQPFPQRQGPIGQVVREMIADRQHAPSVRRVNGKVSHCVDSIVRRCLESNPTRRYGSARQLYEDLRRQLDDLPLRHAPDRSLAERTGKWIRRHPRLASATTMAVVSAIALAALAGMWMMRGRQVARFEAAAQFQRQHEQTLVARAMLGVPDLDNPALAEGVRLARGILKQYGLTDAGDWRQQPAYRLLDGDAQRQLDRDLGGVLYLLARVSVREASEFAGTPTKHEPLQEALWWNRLAGQMYQPGSVPLAIQLQHAEILDATNRHGPANEIRSAATAQTTGEPMDQCLLALQMFAEGQYEDALARIEQARRELPEDSSIWLLTGNGLAALGQRYEAEGCFTTCITLWPDGYLGYFHRGLCRFQLGKYQHSKDDFDVVLRLRPQLIPALVNRALAHQAMGELQNAEHDLTLALEAGAKETRIYFIRSRIRRKLGDLAGSRQDHEEGLRRQPNDAKSWVARGIARLSPEPDAALEDFRQALRLNPRSQSARQNIAHVLSERLNQTKDAIKVLDELLEIEPDDPAAWVARGVLHARLGDREAAVADAERALQLETTADMRYQLRYQAGCIYALASQRNPNDARTAVALIGQAIRHEPKWLRLAATDPDLNALRANEEFRSLLVIINDLDKFTTQH